MRPQSRRMSHHGIGQHYTAWLSDPIAYAASTFRLRSSEVSSMRTAPEPSAPSPLSLLARPLPLQLTAELPQLPHPQLLRLRLAQLTIRARS